MLHGRIRLVTLTIAAAGLITGAALAPATRAAGPRPVIADAARRQAATWPALPGPAGTARLSGAVHAVQRARAAAAARRRPHRRRAAARPVRAASAPAADDQAATGSTTAYASPRDIAWHLLDAYGWAASQFSCLDQLWTRESGWNPLASNPGSGAYGIPQALPGAKMAAAGPDWATSALTQIRWGLSYIRAIYQSPCGAFAHEEATGWY